MNGYAITTASFDLDAAQRFLLPLKGMTPICWQVFDDFPDKRREVAKILHGSLEQVLPELEQAQRDGCGVFITVNETDGAGRKRENVEHATACFVDGDNVAMPDKWPIEPHIITKRDDNHWHAYWLIEPTTDFDAWSSMQARLAAFYGTDPKIIDPPRVMRVPGFFHQKSDPVLVELVRANDGRRISLAEMQEAHPVEFSPPATRAAAVDQEPVVELDDDNDIERARQWLLNQAPSAIEGDGGDATTLKVAAQLKDMGMSQETCFDLMSNFWNDECEPPWSDDELKTKVRNAYAYCRDKRPGEDSPRADFEAIEVTDPGTKVPDWLQELNAKHFAVRNGGKFAIGTEEFDPVLKRRVLRLSSKADFENFYCNILVEVSDSEGSKLVPKGSAWVKNPRRRTYDGLVFDPMHQHEGKFNLWRGWEVTPKPGDWSLFRELITEVLCDGDENSAKYVLDWIAAMVQRPNEPAEVALCFRGKKGTGKSTFGRALVRLAGQHGMHISSVEHLVGRFNDHLRDVICLFGDEAFYAGNNRHESVLKALITEPILVYEAKGQPIMIGQNLLHVIMASNNDWIVPASADERRFAVFDVSDKRQQDKAFFGAINEEIKNGGLEAMLYDLRNRDIDRWHPRDSVPQTVGLVAQKLESMGPLQSWWHSLLELGELPVGAATDNATWADGAVEVRATSDEGQRFAIGKDALLGSFGDHATRQRKSSQMSKAKMAQFLRQVGIDVEAKDKRGNRVWRIPRIEDARIKFQEWIGGELNWEE